MVIECGNFFVKDMGFNVGSTRWRFPTRSNSMCLHRLHFLPRRINWRRIGVRLKNGIDLASLLIWSVQFSIYVIVGGSQSAKRGKIRCTKFHSCHCIESITIETIRCDDDCKTWRGGGYVNIHRYMNMFNRFQTMNCLFICFFRFNIGIS